YYRRFIRSFGIIARPLTNLLKKDAFKWSDEAQRAFLELKTALSTVLVLTLPDIEKQFIIKTDACAYGLGAVLMQEKHPISFLSKAISLKQQGLSVYEKELLAILMVVKQWHYYLITGPFVIRTDQHSLKHLLMQKVTIPLQHKWLARLLGYDYTIEYKAGQENVAADSLSRVQGLTLFTMEMSQIEPLLLDEIVASQGNDIQLKRWENSFEKEDRFCHESPMASHSRINGKGKDIIFVMVDRLTKYSHFMVLGHPYSAKEVAQVFIDNVYKLHGCPSSIISDHDPIFLSAFWKEFLALQGIDSKLYTAYHPQTDGQTEVVNRCLEGYLRCMVMERPLTCVKWVALAEWWYNTSFHSSIGMTPFKALYGFPPPLHIPYIPKDSVDKEVDELMRDREATMNNSLRVNMHSKLTNKYFGPFLIVERIGKVAYRLDLPSYSQIHPVFHVSLLKLASGQPGKIILIPTESRFRLQPLKVLDHKMVKRGSRAAMKILEKKDGPPELLKSLPECIASYDTVVSKFQDCSKEKDWDAIALDIHAAGDAVNHCQDFADENGAHDSLITANNIGALQIVALSEYLAKLCASQ
nr:Ty3/gypsy retrotransposon protein [Tanacetum cinerariifolium]